MIRPDPSHFQPDWDSVLGPEEFSPGASASLRGRFLIAAKGLIDPNFYRSVVLIVEHSSQGAMGLIVNRPSSVSVAHALSEHFDLSNCDDLVYIGGPVQPSALFILHNQADLDPDETAVLPGLYVGSSAEAFEAVVNTAAGGCPEVDYRIYSGCAGWAPGQLEGEIGRGDWFHHPADGPTLFADDPYRVWDDLRCRLHRSPQMVPDLPGEPEWN